MSTSATPYCPLSPDRLKEEDEVSLQLSTATCTSPPSGLDEPPDAVAPPVPGSIAPPVPGSVTPPVPKLLCPPLSPGSMFAPPEPPLDDGSASSPEQPNTGRKVPKAKRVGAIVCFIGNVSERGVLFVCMTQNW